MSGPEDANEIEESDSTRPSVSINTAGLQGKFLSHLQRLLDIVAFHFTGASSVDATSYKEYRPFQSIDVVADRKLDFETARNESERWVLTNCVRDMIEASHVFLEECRIVAALALVSKEGKISSEDFNRIVATERKRFHDLGLPKKLESLRTEFGVQTDFEKHLLSLNRMRACLVHRLGVVSDKDIDESGGVVPLSVER